MVGVMALLGVMATAGAAAEGDLTLESVDSSENQGIGSSIYPSISSDGRFVAFASTASNLVAANDVNGHRVDIFVRDRQRGTTEMVSVDGSGNQANDGCRHASISSDGRFVAFGCDATNLVANDTNERKDVFVHDRWTGSTRRVSVDSSGNQLSRRSIDPSISSDGSVVAFVSNRVRLRPDIFVRDRHVGTTQRVSENSSGKPGNDQSFTPAISSDGRFVTFESRATNLVTNDTNGTWDIFVYERESAAP